MSMEYKEALKVVQEDVERLGELKEACEVIMTLYDVAENSYHEGLEDGQMVCEEKWIPCSEKLPEDGTWNIWQSKTGAISIERYKEDAYNHFYPSGRFFSLEDAVAWMPLPERYKAEEEDE